MSTVAPPSPETSRSNLADAVIARAEGLLRASLAERTPAERREAEKLGGLVNDSVGKAFTFAMVDQVFRSHSRRKQAARWHGLIERFGIPKYLPLTDRALMQIGEGASTVFPQIVMPQVEARLRADSARVILPGEPEPLKAYLQQRRAAGFRINVNQLGEAVLGEEEAQRRLEAIVGHLANPDIDYVSVKISAVFSQINLVAWEETLEHIKARLRTIYRAALPARKFVNLDMEEYRDLRLTVDAFKAVLEEEEFLALSAGIVLQGYLPDSWAAQRELTEWSRARMERGGADIKLRLVKGANLAMEAVEAELHGWAQAPYATKTETDANYRRMLEYACAPENAAAVRVGVASHNLFDIALALELRERCGTGERIELEMLEGMANHQARAVRSAAGDLLLYSPVVNRADFLSAMAYLVRRLDENTAPENFLRASFQLTPGSAEWHEEVERFRSGWALRESVSAAPRRPMLRQPRSLEFCNSRDTDWTNPGARSSLHLAISKLQPLQRAPLPGLEVVLDIAVRGQSTWAQQSIEQRANVLRDAADLMETERFCAIAWMVRDAKKSVQEADPEVSEAIDFARYYAGCFQVPEMIAAEPLGVVVVAPPWNFPYAIPASGVLAALIAGNSVILKPAPETVEIAQLLADQLWRAGVPRDALQFYPCDDGEVGKALITDPRVAAVVLTGGWETASMFRKWRPSLRLYAETSGKNALVITAQADRELAIKDLVRSALSHSGQKCSAGSLAILEAEVYDDPDFRRQLRDAAASLPVGPATELSSAVTPIIREPSDALRRALTQLDSGEEWLLEPRQVGDDPCLWSPGIKLGVQPGSWYHHTECFGPVLGLMRAESLAQAVDWQNATAFGLTAGLHSLDEAEQEWWQHRVQAGNLYINRSTVGAIVQRQPFGGWKRSSVGPGAKAGGPNYPLLFARFSDVGQLRMEEVESDYLDCWLSYFMASHDPSGLRAESNVFRYVPCKGVLLRVSRSDTQTIRRAQFAAQICHVPLEVSFIETESDDELIRRFPRGKAEFFRTITPPSDDVLDAAYEAGLNWIDAPLTCSGRLELRYWLREQSVSRTLHRYGQISDVSRLAER